MKAPGQKVLLFQEQTFEYLLDKELHLSQPKKAEASKVMRIHNRKTFPLAIENH